MNEVDKFPWERLRTMPDQYEMMTESPPSTYGRGRVKGKSYKKGHYTDVGMCVGSRRRRYYRYGKNPQLADYDKFCINFWQPIACNPFQRMQ